LLTRGGFANGEAERSMHRMMKKSTSRVILALVGVFCATAILSTLVVLRPGPGDVASATRAALASYDVALKMFRLDTGNYPTTEQGLKVLVDGTGVPGWKGPYILRNHGPVDSWGTPYRYTYRTNGFAIRSAGADAHFDTDDDVVTEDASNQPSQPIAGKPGSG
jgi:general secretion pathway protein G